MRIGGLALSLLAFAWAGCNLPPKDPFVSAERAMKRDDLLQALRAYDTVPVAHERYPEARAAAGAVELRMRRCHELILEALMLRGEWRDEEALSALRRAREQWTAEPSLDQWIEATEQRMLLFGGRRTQVVQQEPPPERKAVPVTELPAGDEPSPMPLVGQAARPPSASLSASGPIVSKTPAPVEQPAEVPVGSFPAPGGEFKPLASKPVMIPSQRPEPLPVVEPRAVVERQPEPAAADEHAVKPIATARLPDGEDRVGAALVAIEGRLVRGELGGAVAELHKLAERNPQEQRVNVRLGRLLYQRALLYYGQGSLQAAIADWQRVLELDPGRESVRTLLQRAMDESASLAQKRSR